MCQDRIMVTITCMLVVANVQSSVGDMIPKTSYFKMIDYFLLYSLNIIILVMVQKYETFSFFSSKLLKGLPHLHDRPHTGRFCTKRR